MGCAPAGKAWIIPARGRDVAARPHAGAPLCELRGGGKLFVEEEVGDLLEIGLARQLLDRVPPVEEPALLAVQTADRRLVRDDPFKTLGIRPCLHAHAIPLLCRAFRPSRLDEKPPGILDELLHPLEEADRLPPVDQPVVVGQRHVHHGPNDDLLALAVGCRLRDRPPLDGVHPEDGRLRVVEQAGWRAASRRPRRWLLSKVAEPKQPKK